MSSSTVFDYEAVLKKCASGKRSALMQLYHQEAPRLLTVTMRILQNRALSEDVVHDAFIKIWSNAQSYNSDLGSARGWIYTLTRNLALNAVKYSGRQLQVDPDFMLDLIDSHTLEKHQNEDSHNEDFLALRALYGCLDDLEPEPKRCILHAYIDGYTQDEISKLLNKPLGSVKSWIKRSLNTLKECLE